MSSERTLDPAALRTACATTCPNLPLTVCPTLANALEKTEQDACVLITGSLYLVGEAMDELRALPAKHPTERALNDWTGARAFDPQRVR